MLLFALLALAADGGPLLLSAKATKTTVFVGEPIKLVLDWHSTAPVAATGTALGFAVDNGAGVRLYLGHVDEVGADPGGQERSDFTVAGMLKPGDHWVSNLVLVGGSYTNARSLTDLRRNQGAASRSAADFEPGFLFPKPGRYKVRVQHFINDGYGPAAESNPVDFTVRAPTGDDLEVFQLVLRNPGILSGHAEAEALLQKYPRSPYLRWARIQRINLKESYVINGYDPEKGITAEGPLPKAQKEPVARDFHRRVTDTVGSEEDWGAFEEERLALLMHHAQFAHDGEVWTRARGLLLERFSNSPTVKTIKAREAARDNEDEGRDGDQKEPTPKPTPKGGQ